MGAGEVYPSLFLAVLLRLHESSSVALQRSSKPKNVSVRRRGRGCAAVLVDPSSGRAGVELHPPSDCLDARRKDLLTVVGGRLMDPEAEGSTPTSQWAPPQSWWVGDDARSEDGHTDDLRQPYLPSSSRNGRRRSRLMFAAETESTGEDAPHRDPRSLFGDLPNSSLDPDVLGDPIQRELELRAAGAGTVRRSPTAAAAAAPAEAAAGPLTVTFADSARSYSDNFRGNGNGADVHGFWRDECGRLQGQIASLDRERER